MFIDRGTSLERRKGKRLDSSDLELPMGKQTRDAEARTGVGPGLESEGVE